MNHAAQNPKGFSLIELIVVIAILSILGAIATPVFSRWLPNAQMSASVRDLQSLVQKARLEAVKRNRTLFMDLDDSRDRCSVFLDDGSTPGQLDGNDTLINIVGMPDRVDFYGADSGAGLIQFNSRGMLMASDLLKMKNVQGTYKGVAISVTGKSWIVRSSDNGATWQ